MIPRRPSRSPLLPPAPSDHLRLRRYLGERRPARRHPCADRRAPRPGRSQPQDSANPGVSLLNSTGSSTSAVPRPRCAPRPARSASRPPSPRGRISRLTRPGRRPLASRLPSEFAVDQPSRRTPAVAQAWACRGLLAFRYAQYAGRLVISLVVSFALLITCDCSTPQLTARFT